MKHDKEPNKHKLKSEATRTALLQAAEKIFARDGYESAQIDEIAGESGRTRGAVYAQYKTKEQLFFAVQEQRVENAAQDLYAILGKIDKEDYQTRLSALRGYYASLHDANGAILDLEMKLFALRHAESVEKWRENYLRMFPSREFKREFGLKQEAAMARIQNRVTALAAVKGGLILAMNFLPDQLTSKETTLILTQIFDGLFPGTAAARRPSGKKKAQPRVTRTSKKSKQAQAN